MRNKLKEQAGFTLIETLLTIFIVGILMEGTTLLIRDIFRASGQQFGILSNTNQATMISDAFANEIRNATYGVDGSYPVNQAGDNQIIFFTSLKGNGTILKIRYYISGNTLYKGVTKPGGSPLSYVGQTETVTSLSTQMSMGSNPLLYYYDGNYNGNGTPLSQPININVVKFVKINLIILKKLMPNSNDTFTVTAGSSIRNLKTNLGN